MSPATPRPDPSELCEGSLLETGDRTGACDAGSACRALRFQDDYSTYRQAHERVVTAEQQANTHEYGGEA